MADTHVYVSDQDGHQSDEIESFLIAVISGSMTDAYNQRFGHFGPRGIVGPEDLPPQAPTELEDLEPEDGELPGPDDWE